MKWSRKQKRKFGMVGFLLSLVALVSAALAGESQGNAFRFKLKGDRFTLSVTQKFDPRKTLEDVRAVFSDHSLLVEVSNLITKVKVTPLADSSYLLETKATKAIDVGVKIEKSAVTVNRCTEQSGNASWERKCQVSLSKGDAAKFILEGKSSIRCEENAARKGAVTCISTTDVRPKPIRYWPVYVRSPQQLAVSGAIETLHDLGVLFMVANSSLSPKLAKAAFAETTLGQLSQRFFEEVRGMADRNEIGGRAVQVDASELSGKYELKVQ